MSKINEFIKAIQEDKAYGWIANHGCGLSKDELCNIIKEYDYAIQSMKPYDTKEDIHNAVAEELMMIYGEE
jgi:hypothetical protein